MSLVPCRFYGTANGCRFGDNCKFYHARGGNNQIVPGAFGRQQGGFNSGGLAQAQQDVLNLATKSQQNMDAMIDMVKKDMVEWENGHIFPFSCYGPSAGKPCVPGFEEISAEELRYRFYVLNNKTPVDLTREVSVMQQARMQYLQISPAIRNILERVIVKGERIDSTGMTLQPLSPQTQNAFQMTRPANVFGGGSTTNQPSANIFGQPSTGTSLFGGSTTGQASGIFGSPAGQQQNSLFGGGLSNHGQQSSLFGGPSVLQPAASSIFGSSPSTNAASPNQTSSIFGNPASPSVFGAASQPAATGSLFGGGINTSGVFGGTTTGGGGLFGTSNSTTGTSLFGNTPTVSPFGGTSQASSIFQQSQPPTMSTSGLFSSSSNMFGNSTTSTNATVLAQPQTSSIFGQPQQPSQFSNSPTLQGLLQQPNPMAPQQQQQPTSLFGTPPAMQPQTQQTGGLPTSGSFFSSPSQLATPPIFGQSVQPQTSLFGTPPTTSSLQSGFSNPSSLFGGGGGGGGTGMTPVDQKYVYTDESELTPEELEAFRAPVFTLENIPTRPPPKSLCGV